MKLYLSVIAFVIVSLFIFSGFVPASSPLAVGEEAPLFSVSSDTAEFSLLKARGERVLVTFWSVSDAESRSRCHFYSATLAGSDVRHIAINLDQNSTLYKELSQADGLCGKDFFSPEATQATQLARSFALDGNFGSILISESGKVLAFNPDPEQISRKR